MKFSLQRKLCALQGAGMQGVPSLSKGKCVGVDPAVPQALGGV